MRHYHSSLKPLSRQLRNNMTDAERRLWLRLRGKQVLGVPFYRQKPLASYIVDFYCPAASLVIEVDGSQHYEASAQQYDREREQVLMDMGLLVLRFDNRQVLLETDSVMQRVFECVSSRLKR